MKDIEDLLKKAPLSAPSPSLDNRVEKAVIEAAQRQVKQRPAGVPFWAFAAGCLACTLVGFLIHPLVDQKQPPAAGGPSAVVYIVEPARHDLRILGTKPENDATPFFQEKRGEIKPLVRNE